jgi:quercetin dioxygenase-like cupin family protein
MGSSIKQATIEGILYGILISLVLLGIIWVARDKEINFVSHEMNLKVINLISEKLGKKGEISRRSVAQYENLAFILVSIGKPEEPHIHQKSDLIVIILEGEGEINIEGEKKYVEKGDIIFIPKNKVHFFVNKGVNSALALVISSPPLQKDDYLPVK